MSRFRELVNILLIILGIMIFNFLVLIGFFGALHWIIRVILLLISLDLVLVAFLSIGAYRRDKYL